MKAVVIGGTGHIGTYLTPRLVNAGYKVISISRQQRKPYQNHSAWGSVKLIEIDREATEQEGQFGAQIENMNPDVVIDLICFTLESARQLVTALEGRVRHFIHCGTIWVHGHSVEVPTIESQARKPLCEYGIKKLAIEEFLLKEARVNGFPATVLHPGHIVGQGWIPINPAGNLNPQVFSKLAQGREVVLPNLGMETVHHVHADDVAQAFMLALDHWSVSVGESFHVVSPAALTLRGYAESMADWFGQSPLLRFQPWETWQKMFSDEDSRLTWEHIIHSPNCSIAKAQRLLGYYPRYSSLQAAQEAVSWLINNGVIKFEIDTK